MLVSRKSDVIDLRWQQCVSIIHCHPFVRQVERWVERRWGGRTEFRPGLESFSITYDVSLESTLIELPNLFFKQQCPGPDPWRETIRYEFKIGHFIYFIFFVVYTEKELVNSQQLLSLLHASSSFNVHGLTISWEFFHLKDACMTSRNPHYDKWLSLHLSTTYKHSVLCRLANGAGGNYHNFCRCKSHFLLANASSKSLHLSFRLKKKKCCRCKISKFRFVLCLP